MQRQFRLPPHRPSDLTIYTFSLGPILDSSEFVARFSAHIKGTHPLGHEGSVISLLLVVWAASYGVDEYGVPVDQDDQGFDSSHSMSHNDFAASGRSTRSGVSTSLSRTSKQTRESSKTRYSRRDAIENMLREILELVDYHSILRKPSWDPALLTWKSTARLRGLRAHGRSVIFLRITVTKC